MSWQDDPSDPMYQAVNLSGTPAAWALRQGNKPVTDPVTGKDTFDQLASWMTGGSQAHAFPYGTMRVTPYGTLGSSLMPRVNEIIAYMRGKLPGVKRLEDKFDYNVSGVPERMWMEPETAAASHWGANPKDIRVLMGPQALGATNEQAAPILLHEMLHPYFNQLHKGPGGPEIMRAIGRGGKERMMKDPTAADYVRRARGVDAYRDPKEWMEELAVLSAERNAAMNRFGRQNWP